MLTIRGRETSIRWYKCPAMCSPIAHVVAFLSSSIGSGMSLTRLGDRCGEPARCLRCDEGAMSCDSELLKSFSSTLQKQRGHVDARH
jgi:hypothetical protein